MLCSVVCCAVLCCRESLLNAFSDVDEAGNFTSSIAKPRDRFLKVCAQMLWQIFLLAIV